MKHWLETRQVLTRVAEVARGGGRAALATVVRVRGSAYRHEGAKMLVLADGTALGNVSGGCLEQDVREVARQVIESGVHQLRSYCSGSDEVEAWDLGLGCDGQVDVFVEPIDAERTAELELLHGRRAFAACSVVGGPAVGLGRRLVVMGEGTAGALGDALDPWVAERARERLVSGQGGVEESGGHAVFVDVLCPPPQLVLFGAGDDAVPLARSAADVGFRVVVVDYRRAYLTPDRFPGAAQLLLSDGSDGLAPASLGHDSFAVVMTHNFAHDQAYVAALLATDVPYIGMLGPKVRRERIVQNLEQAGLLSPERKARLYGPVGLDLGTDGPEQVGLSVIAEVLAVRSGRAALSLRERSIPIHGER